MRPAPKIARHSCLASGTTWIVARLLPSWWSMKVRFFFLGCFYQKSSRVGVSLDKAPPTLYNGRYYQQFIAAVNWSTALTAAADSSYNGWKGHLATFYSQREFNAVRGLANRAATWIAGSDAAEEGVWRWMAGPEEGSLISLTFWNPDEPNDQEDCLMLAQYDSWEDGPCGSTAAFIAEYEAVWRTATSASSTEIAWQLLAAIGGSIAGFILLAWIWHRISKTRAARQPLPPTLDPILESQADAMNELQDFGLAMRPPAPVLHPSIGEPPPYSEETHV
eukprot:m.457331 g.457331  ORF g.457331 m.457331 type:complete len:278 (+) comp56982_c0_seq5:1668-2501(+)